MILGFENCLEIPVELWVRRYMFSSALEQSSSSEESSSEVFSSSCITYNTTKTFDALLKC